MTKRGILLMLYFFTSVYIGFGQAGTEDEKVFSVESLKADLKYLKNKLENNHPGLYLYSSKEVIDKTFDSLESSLAKPLTGRAFYKHISIISSVIKDGHTIILPASAMSVANGDTSTFLPYHLLIIDGRLYADMVFTNDRSIPEGAEITSINNLAAADVIKELTDRQVRDGNNLTYPTWILSNYFRQYFSFIYGHPPDFSIGYSIKEIHGNATIKALPKDSIYYYRQQKYPGKVFSKLPGEGLKLETDPGNRYALLTIKDFHDDVLKKEYRQHFNREIASFFEQIINSGTRNLILDLRNNQGGDIENGVYLLAYLLDKPFSVVNEYFNITHSEMKHCNGPSLGKHNPKTENFKGNLYVLINGGSFSNSGIVASCLRANKRAVFVGEETGGNPDVLTGFSNDINLPNTKIYVEVPTKQFVMTSKVNNQARGLMPDQLVAPSIEDILSGNDRALHYTIDLINKTEQSAQ